MFSSKIVLQAAAKDALKPPFGDVRDRGLHRAFGRAVFWFRILRIGKDLLPCGEDANNALFLVPTQPRLEGFTQELASEVVDHMTDQDQNECDWIHPMNGIIEYVDPNNHVPEVDGEERDVKEGRRCESEQQRRQRVEEDQAEGISNQVSGHLAIPDCGLEVRPIKDAGDDAVDDHAIKGELPDYLVYRSLARHEFLHSVREAVASGSHQREQITLDHIVPRVVSPTGAGDVVRREQHAQATDTDQNSYDLGKVVPHVHQEEGEHDDYNNGPDEDQLDAKEGSISKGQNDEIISKNVEECQYDICPAVLEDYIKPLLETVLVKRIGRVNDIQEYIGEEGLE